MVSREAEYFWTKRENIPFLLMSSAAASRSEFPGRSERLENASPRGVKEPD